MKAFRSEELFGAEDGPTGRSFARSLPLANKTKPIVDPVFAFALLQESVYAALWKKLVSGVVGVGGWWFPVLLELVVVVGKRVTGKFQV